MTEEYVVLVNEQDHEIGTILKSQVHGATTPLHRAFSCFIFDSEGNILLQQRAGSKKTRPLVWSNSCCGHPLPDESYEDAVVRRVHYELWITITLEDVIKVSNYRYCFSRYWVMENEFCPIFVVYTNNIPTINPEEVEQIILMKRSDWLNELQHDIPWPTWKRSERCKEEVIFVNTWLETEGHI